MKRIPRRIFREEFKREAIRLVNEQGLTIAEASRKLDVASKSLRTWIKQEQSGELKASLAASKLTADQLRIRELERELSIAKTERDILMALALGHPVSSFLQASEIVSPCSLTSLIASRLNSSRKIRRGIRFMETPGKLIK